MDIYLEKVKQHFLRMYIMDQQGLLLYLLFLKTCHQQDQICLFIHYLTQFHPFQVFLCLFSIYLHSFLHLIHALFSYVNIKLNSLNMFFNNMCIDVLHFNLLLLYGYLYFDYHIPTSRFLRSLMYLIFSIDHQINYLGILILLLLVKYRDFQEVFLFLFLLQVIIKPYSFFIDLVS